MGSNCKEDGFGPQQGFSTIAAVAAWGLPAAHTIAVLVTRDVDADELTGTYSIISPFNSKDQKGMLQNRKLIEYVFCTFIHQSLLAAFTNINGFFS